MPFCDREFDVNKGLKIHLSRCDLKRTQVNTKIPIEGRDKIEVFLQPDNIYRDTEWYNISGKEFVGFMNRTYDNIIHWRKICSNFLPVKQVVYLLMNLLSG